MISNEEYARQSQLIASRLRTLSDEQLHTVYGLAMSNPMADCFGSPSNMWWPEFIQSCQDDLEEMR